MEAKPTFVILGATGDLTQKKLLPALYKILEEKELKDILIIGVSRQKISANKILKNAKKNIKKVNEKIWTKFEKKFHYYQSDFADDSKFSKLKPFIKSLEQKHNMSGNRVFYLATLPQFFKLLARQLHKHKLATEKQKWKRIIFEKPFGSNLKSAKKINRAIQKVFGEKQIYRIDHYLGKELVQNISVLRFTNTVLAPLFTKNKIDHVQIIITEPFGVEKRGAFYDKYGALKDVAQNHMLQMLSLVTMQAPKQLIAKNIRDQKVKILKAIKNIKEKDIVLGQYDGYLNEKGVLKNSKTETFAAFKLYINTPNWRGVPFYFITGKNLPKRNAGIYLQMKQAPCLAFNKVCNFNPNYLKIQIQPEDGFYLQLNAKTPGKINIQPIKMEFCHKCKFGPNTPVAYENLLLDVVKGDQSTFVRSDEIEASWKIIDSIKNKKVKLHKYKKGTYPKVADKFIQKDGRQWALNLK